MYEGSQMIHAHGVMVYFFSVRRPGERKRFYYGQVRSREQALAMAEHYQATGEVLKDSVPDVVRKPKRKKRQPYLNALFFDR